MQSKNIFLVLVTIFSSLSLYAESVEFSRGSTYSCVNRYAISLGADESYMSYLCENYSNDNISCAIRNKNKYSISDSNETAKALLNYCVMPYNNSRLHRCIEREMTQLLRSGDFVDILAVTDECKNPSSKVSAPSTYVAPPFRVYDFKVPQEIMRSNISQWLGVTVDDIQQIQVSRYFHIVDQYIEDLSLYAFRDVRLHEVNFLFKNEAIECIGTDYDPLNSQLETRYFTVDSCAINGEEESFKAQFDAVDELNIDYSQKAEE